MASMVSRSVRAKFPDSRADTGVAVEGFIRESSLWSLRGGDGAGEEGEVTEQALVVAGFELLLCPTVNSER